MVNRRVLSNDPIMGIFDDVSDAWGVWRATSFLPTPVGLAKQIGLPAVKDILPSPDEVGREISAGLPKIPMIIKPPTKALLMAPAQMFDKVSPF